MSQFSFFYSRRIVTVSKVLNVTIICGAKVARAHHTSEQLIPDDPNNLGVAPIFREPNDFCSGVGGPRNLLVKNILGPTAKTLGKLGDLLSIRRAIKFHKISQTKIKSRINLNFKQFYHFWRNILKDFNEYIMLLTGVWNFLLKAFKMASLNPRSPKIYF